MKKISKTIQNFWNKEKEGWALFRKDIKEGIKEGWDTITDKESWKDIWWLISGKANKEYQEICKKLDQAKDAEIESANRLIKAQDSWIKSAREIIDLQENSIKDKNKTISLQEEIIEKQNYIIKIELGGSND